jgi:hypothetical protein
VATVTFVEQSSPPLSTIPFTTDATDFMCAAVIAASPLLSIGAVSTAILPDGLLEIAIKRRKLAGLGLSSGCYICNAF